MKESKWYTIKQAAEYLSIGEPTLYRWMRDGKITYRKIGDSTRFLQRDLEAFVKVVPAEGDDQAVKQRCAVCQGEELIKGRLQSTGATYFKPEKSRFWTFKESQVPTETYMCTTCGYLNTFGNLEHLRDLTKES